MQPQQPVFFCTLQQQRRIIAAIGVTMIALLILACGPTGGVVSRAPGWACPSPVPLPYGSSGPIKDTIALPTDVPIGPQLYEDVYYEQWEREYGEGGSLLEPGQVAFSGPPFPSPTPYSMVGDTYTFKQMVRLEPFYIKVRAEQGPMITDPGLPPNQQVQWVVMEWQNTNLTPEPFNFETNVRIRSIINPAGAEVSDTNWGTSQIAREIVGATPPPALIEPTTQGNPITIRIPIITPVGKTKSIEVRFEHAGIPTATPVLGGPTPTPVTNINLQAPTDNSFPVLFSDTELAIGPPCATDGVYTSWGEGSAWGQQIPGQPIPPPPGASRLIELALNQVGKPYVWGAKGPETFDCSGLTQWLYAQIGIQIPTGTGRGGNGGQWGLMTPVDAANLQQGDLIFFNIGGSGVDHVGLVADVNNDGSWDLIHAASPEFGVRVDYNVFGSAYYTRYLLGFRTAR